jgi:hypothetical protein
LLSAAGIPELPAAVAAVCYAYKDIYFGQVFKAFLLLTAICTDLPCRAFFLNAVKI